MGSESTETPLGHKGQKPSRILSENHLEHRLGHTGVQEFGAEHRGGLRDAGAAVPFHCRGGSLVEEVRREKNLVCVTGIGERHDHDDAVGVRQVNGFERRAIEADKRSAPGHFTRNQRLWVVKTAQVSDGNALGIKSARL